MYCSEGLIKVEKWKEGLVNNSMLHMLRDGTLFKKMSKLANLVFLKKCGFFYSKVFCRGEGESSSIFN
jgi:hypothetical protein